MKKGNQEILRAMQDARACMGKSRVWHEANNARKRSEDHKDIPYKRLSQAQIKREYTPERIERLLSEAEANRQRLACPAIFRTFGPGVDESPT